MSALKLVRTILLADGDVMGEADQVFVVRAKQGTPPPFIVLGLVGETEWLRALAGAAGQYEARVSVACHAVSAAAADAMAETVKGVLGDLTGHVVMDGATRLGEVETWVSGASMFDWSEDGSVYRRIVDFGLRWGRP